MPIFQYPYVSVYIPRGNLMLSLMFGWVRPRVVGCFRGRRFQEQLQDLQEQLEAARLQAVDDVGFSWDVGGCIFFVSWVFNPDFGLSWFSHDRVSGGTFHWLPSFYVSSRSF